VGIVRLNRASLWAALPLLLAGCGEENTYVAPPPPKVTVAQPVQKTVTRYLEATGNAAAINTANLVARVQGFVRQIHYKDGDEVRKGQLLFTIEPETYLLKLDQAKAAEAAAEATLKQTQAEYDRQVELQNRQVASKAALDNAVANRDSAAAKLQQAKSDTALADLNYTYTRVIAPFDGIVTARQVSLGEMVGATSPTVLATIIQLEPIYVNFNINEQELQRVMRTIQRLGITPEQLKKLPVEAGLQTETGYPHKGQLDYAAPSVSASTGTLTLRGIFPNERHPILPGFYLRVRVPAPEQTTSLLVPQTAVGSDQIGRYVLVVNKDNVVEQRKIEMGPLADDGMRIVESGLNPDDRVVVSGILRAVPGQKVDPQTEQIPAAAGGK
jgi:RND family efflux transporter MFP subunit